MRRILATGVLVSLAATLLTAGPAGAQATPTTKAAALVEPAVVYLEMQWTVRIWSPATTEYTAGYLSSEPFTFATRCTGFVVNPEGYIATAGHCVDPSREEGAGYTAITSYGISQFLDIRDMSYTEENINWVYETFDPISNWKVHGSSKGSKPELDLFVQHGVAAGGVTTGESMTARVLDYQKWSEGDAALIKVETTNDLPALELSPEADIEIGTQVLAVGYPGAADEVTDASYEPTFQDGQVNSEKTRGSGALPVYEISSEMTGGMSGGPTTDLQGRVVGVNSYGDLSGSYNFISPVSLVDEMLANNGVENSLGPVDKLYRSGLKAFFAKSYDEAAYYFDQATGLSPGHQLAQEYLQESRAKGGDPTAFDPEAAEGGGSMMLIIIIAAAVLLLGGGGAAFFLMRRRRRESPGPVGAPEMEMIPPAEGVETGNGQAEVEEIPPPPPVEEAPKPRAAATKTRKAAASKAGKAAATRAAPKAKFCSECGSEVAAGAKFCGNCGNTLA